MKDICSGIEKIREVGTAAEPAGGERGASNNLGIWVLSVYQAQYNLTYTVVAGGAGPQKGKCNKALWVLEEGFFSPSAELQIVARDFTSCTSNRIGLGLLTFSKMLWNPKNFLSSLLMLWFAVSKRISPSNGERGSRLSHLIKVIEHAVTPLRSWTHKMCHLWKFKKKFTEWFFLVG